MANLYRVGDIVRRLDDGEPVWYRVVDVGVSGGLTITLRSGLGPLIFVYPQSVEMVQPKLEVGDYVRHVDHPTDTPMRVSAIGPGEMFTLADYLRAAHSADYRRVTFHAGINVDEKRLSVHPFFRGVQDDVNAMLERLDAAMPKPELPTEVGSVIRNATIRGSKGHMAMLTDLELKRQQLWVTATRAGGHRWHDPDHITAWEVVE